MRALAAGLALALFAHGTAAAGDPIADCVAGARDGAVAACERAVDLKPDDAGLRRAYAYSLMVQGRQGEAIVAYDDATRLAPDDARAYYDLAAALVGARIYDNAVAPILRSLELNPDNLTARLLAVIVFQVLQRNEEALTHLKLAADQGAVTAMYDLYQAYALGLGTAPDQAQAFHWLDQAARHGHILAMRNLAQIHLDGGLGRDRDAQAAADWFNRAIAAEK